MRSSKTIHPRVLKRLYQEEKLSSPKIAGMYRLTPEQVRSLLRKQGIAMRTKPQARRLLFQNAPSEKDLRELYTEQRLSSVQIADRFACSPGFIRNTLRKYGIPLRSPHAALALSNKSRYPQKDFSGDAEEKAYLLGLAKGDLHVRKASALSSTIFIQTNTTKPEMLRLVEKSFSSYGHMWKGKPAKNSAVCIRFSLNSSFSFLLSKKDDIPRWILRSPAFFASFLAGYSDAEGSFCLSRGSAVFSIRSQDKVIIHKIRKRLVELKVLLRPEQIARRAGTRDKVGTISNKDIWGIWVYRKESLLRLIALLSPYLRHRDKQVMTKVIQDNILERNAQYNRLRGSKFDKLYTSEGIKL